jgi:D-alanyl-lipoteichoic acid acyltransferase DltB (MBOAT superfamily)
MLFNSYSFIFGFLPVVLAGFWLLGRAGRDPALAWLTAASLFFYAWWRPVNVLLIAPSILINYGLARAMERTGQDRPGHTKVILTAGIIFNLCFLGYFKYLNFFGSALNDAFGAGFVLTQLILPLGISFITFQKIAFLVDIQAGRVSRFTLRDYGLFVLFFPQLIAGPIVHYREMMPQFRAASCRFQATDTAVGLTLFSIGLAKKLILADPLSRLVAPLYGHAAAGVPQSLTEAWIAALGFTLQIYFDFSGYTDMALGLARFFGIKLPMNFNSPLKATSIIDFWLRWHISLTRFLTAYIYNPMTLALTRRRMARGKPVFGGRNTNLSAFLVMLVMPTLLTMLISGVWHGAGYTFILWGLLHGVLLCINHAWRLIRPRIWPDTKTYIRRMAPAGFLLTFLSVVFAMVLFRAPTVSAAVLLWKGMIGNYGAVLPQAILARLGAPGEWLMAIGVHPAWSSGAFLLEAILRIGSLLVIALMLPNTLEILAPYEPALGVKPAKNPTWLTRRLSWVPSGAWAVGLACVALAGMLSLGELSEFLYWQF